MISNTQLKKLTLSLALLSALLASPALRAEGTNPPEVPANLEVPEGHRPYRLAHAVGTQNQICLPRANGVGLGWTFYGPQATLFDEEGTPSHAHFLAPNPDESGTPRPLWQYNGDASAVWGAVLASSSDPEYVETGAIPWLLLQVVGYEPGPDGGRKMRKTTYIQRVNTIGGVAPSTDCPAIGAKLFVPYETDYVLYRAD